MIIEAEGLRFASSGRVILDNVTFAVPEGAFVALLGENGAGKTTLADLILGFRAPTAGSLSVLRGIPCADPFALRQKVAYLSEKIDIPGDWSVREFLDFNAFFYSAYDRAIERDLSARFRLDKFNRLGNMSAGEIRRAQVVAALSSQPRLIVVDEITAVLDIVGRRRFMEVLRERNRASGTTVVMATNILEDLTEYVTHVLLMRHGRELRASDLDGPAARGRDDRCFSAIVAPELEAA